MFCECSSAHNQPSRVGCCRARPQKETVQDPSPPERVVTMIVPGPTALPVLHTSFFEEKYSRDSRQFSPWIFNSAWRTGKKSFFHSPSWISWNLWHWKLVHLPLSYLIWIYSAVYFNWSPSPPLPLNGFTRKGCGLYNFNGWEILHKPMTSCLLEPRFSPLMVTLVPGGPSRGEIPLTTGGSDIDHSLIHVRLLAAAVTLFSAHLTTGGVSTLCARMRMFS